MLCSEFGLKFSGLKIATRPVGLGRIVAVPEKLKAHVKGRRAHFLIDGRGERHLNVV